jgi:D-methionine transport system ATP-binding protein
VVIVTHEMHVIRSICHRAALLDAGEVVEILTVQDKQVSAQSALAKSLLEVA